MNKKFVYQVGNNIKFYLQSKHNYIILYIAKDVLIASNYIFRPL